MTRSQPEKDRTRQSKNTGRKTGAKTSAAKEAPALTSGIKKQYPKSKKVCKVTFRLPSVAAGDAMSVCIVGDFNDWSIHATPMKKMKNGDYTVTLEVAPGREYQFRYLIDEHRWENDWNADKYVPSPYGGSDNSVIVV